MNNHTPHEEIYYNANNQKDYIPLLQDPSVDKKIIHDVVDRISTLELKKLALQHPNISLLDVRYILDKADKKPYHQELIEYAINYYPIDNKSYQIMKDRSNKANRLQILLLDSIRENKIFPEAMTRLAKSLDVTNNRDMMIFQSIISNDECPKEAFEAMFESIKIPTHFMTWALMVKSNAPILMKHKNFPHDRISIFFEETGLEWFLSDSAKDVFLF